MPIIGILSQIKIIEWLRGEIILKWEETVIIMLQSAFRVNRFNINMAYYKQFR